MRTGVWFGVTACAVGTPSIAPADPPPLLEVESARLEAGSLAVEVEKARMDKEGRGSGEVVHASSRSEDPPLDIVANTTAWDLAARTAAFRSNVVLTRGPLRLTTDALDLRLAPGPEPTVTAALAEGSVVVTRGTQSATADRAELDAKAGLLLLTGSPLLQDGPHTLAGERIRFWLEEDRVECDTCRVQVQGGVGLP